MNRTTLHSGAALTLALAATAATALPAAAHVRVIPEATASGGYAAITFRVPNESDTAATIKLVVTLPQDRPLATVSIRPVPGWTARVTTAKLPEKVTANDLTLTEAPRTVTWTADYDLSEDEESQPASADTLARVFGGLALVVALVGAGVAVAGRRRA